MKWHAYHNGQKIPYLLGILLGLDQFLGCFVPGADVDKTPSHRIGVKRAKLAIKKRLVDRTDIYNPDGSIIPSALYDRHVKVILKETRLSFWRHPLEASIDWFLERIDSGHCIRAIGS
jgi:hypothetical protein